MKKDSINRVIGGIEDDIVEMAESKAKVNPHKVSWVKWGSFAAAFVLVLSAAFIVPGVLRQNSIVNPVIPSDNTSQTAENSNNQGQSNNPDRNDSITTPTVAADIIVNELTGSPGAASMDIGLFLEDEILKTPEELCDYYGTNIYPTVLPSNFIKEMFVADDGGYGQFFIYQREDRGVYYDQNTITYVSEEALAEYKRLGYLNWTAPTIKVTVSKVRDVFWDVVIGELAEAPLQASTINGNELTICRYELGNGEHYVAYFTKDGVNFEIDGDLISEKEFIDLLTGYFTE